MNGIPFLAFGENDMTSCRILVKRENVKLVQQVDVMLIAGEL